jgi:hypothetical protein
MKALSRLYQGSIKALSRLYQGSIKELLRRYLSARPPDALAGRRDEAEVTAAAEEVQAMRLC